PRDIPTTPSTLLPSSSLFYKLKSPDNTLSNFTNIKASSSTSLSSLQTIENGWSTNPQSEDVGNSSSLFEGTSGLGSPTRPQTALSTATASVTGLNSSRKWENDEDVVECRRCFKKFGFITRRHHCRKCGQVVCDRCSTARVPLPPNQVLRDPSEVTDTSTSSFYRVCDSCFRTIDLHNRQRSGSTAASINSTSSVSRQRRRDSSSSIFDCPVCGVQLKDIPGGKAAEEEHIKNCLESKNGNNISGYKYV
ncbi:6021_t:CDS:2, partial [Paraglomus occultum]